MVAVIKNFATEFNQWRNYNCTAIQIPVTNYGEAGIFLGNAP
jgi:hypothetical protein